MFFEEPGHILLLALYHALLVSGKIKFRFGKIILLPCKD